MRICIFIMLLLSISCNKQSEKIDVKKTSSSSSYEKYYDRKVKAKKLAEGALSNGNKTLYAEAFKEFVSINCYEDFLYYSIKMAEKYDFGDAYFDSFYLLTLRENDSTIRLNKLANYYLFKAFEKGNVNAKYEISQIYPDLDSESKLSDFFKKNSIKY